VQPKGRLAYATPICSNVEPKDAYYRDNPHGQFFPLARRFARFGIDMEAGVLSFAIMSRQRSPRPRSCAFQTLAMTHGQNRPDKGACGLESVSPFGICQFEIFLGVVI